jgi:hypothetical protein
MAPEQTTAAINEAPTCRSVYAFNGEKFGVCILEIVFLPHAMLCITPRLRNPDLTAPDILTEVVSG